MKETVEVLISADRVEARIAELAAEITEDYAGKPVTLVCVLKGGVVFMTDLARRLDLPVEFEFIDVSSYGAGTVGGNIRFNKDVEGDLAGRHVLLVEDIIDTGNTIKYVCERLKAKNPASFRVCALLDKPERREAEGLTIDYTGFVIPDKFVVGFGLDYAQRYRNLGYIGVLNISED